MESLPAVVVGVDGSQAATAAALWAIPEAVDRGIPLRLVYAIDPRAVRRDDPDEADRRRTYAESVIRTASTIVASTSAPVKVEFEIVSGRPSSVLVRAASSAVMVCVGSVGFKRFAHGHLGSTAAALTTAGIGVLAIVRAQHGPSRHSEVGAVVLEMDASSRSSTVLDVAMDEARRRGAPIRAVTCWQAQGDDCGQRTDAAANYNYQARAYLYRCLAQWKRRYPDLTIHAVTAQGTMAGYLAGVDRRSNQLVVVCTGGRGTVGQFGGPSLSAALQHTNGSVLVCRS